MWSRSLSMKTLTTKPVATQSTNTNMKKRMSATDRPRGRENSPSTLRYELQTHVKVIHCLFFIYIYLCNLLYFSTRICQKKEKKESLDI